jgi:hypothetical protein
MHGLCPYLGLTTYHAVCRWILRSRIAKGVHALWYGRSVALGRQDRQQCVALDDVLAVFASLLWAGQRWQEVKMGVFQLQQLKLLRSELGLLPEDTQGAAERQTQRLVARFVPPLFAANWRLER